jgi:site-specific DNA-methyltransferase (adenine-specific)
MKPVFETELGRFFNSTAQEYLNSVFLNEESKEKFFLFTDPPYGINANSFREKDLGKLAKTTDYGNFDWDIKRPAHEIQQLLLFSERQAIFGGNYYANTLPETNGWIIWDKVNGKSNYSDCEMIWTSFLSATRLIPFMWNGMFQGKSIKEGRTQQGNKKLNEKRYHQAQKPLPLCLEILQRYVNKDEVVVDTYAGSGTISLACEMLGYKWIAVEEVPKFCEDARKRILNYSQMKRFDLV